MRLIVWRGPPSSRRSVRAQPRPGRGERRRQGLADRGLGPGAADPGVQEVQVRLADCAGRVERDGEGGGTRVLADRLQAAQRAVRVRRRAEPVLRGHLDGTNTIRTGARRCARGLWRGGALASKKMPPAQAGGLGPVRALRRSIGYWLGKTTSGIWGNCACAAPPAEVPVSRRTGGRAAGGRKRDGRPRLDEAQLRGRVQDAGWGPRPKVGQRRHLFRQRKQEADALTWCLTWAQRP